MYDLQKFSKYLPNFPWSKYPGEHHLPTHNYTGPGTRLDIRLDENDIPKTNEKPINRIDQASYKHDLVYRDYEDIETRHKADLEMINELKNIQNPTFREKVERAFIIKLLQAKMKLGMGLASELHKEFRKQKHYLKVKVFHKDDIWTADLVEMPVENLGRLGKYKYILTVLDLYTRYAWAYPLKNKQGETIYNTFLDIFEKSNRKPDKLFVDQGSEFYNKHMYKIFKYNKKDIQKKDDNGNYLNKIYSVYNEGKAMMIERLNRTLKQKMYKKFTEQGNQKWVKLIPQIVQEYNNKVHSSIGVSPKQASENPKSINEITAKNNYYNYSNLKLQKQKFQVGDRIRLHKFKAHFEKGYTSRWTKEIFIISEVRKTNPLTYRVKDLEGEDIYGSFYQNELQKSEY